jgi:phosphoglycerate dehydrogenase-like enzyme
MASHPLVLQTEELDDVPAAWLAERARLVRAGEGDPNYAALLAEAEALVVRTYTQVNDGLLSRAPRVKVVGRAGVGLDNIDLEACRRRGVRVVHTPDANSQAVVEFVWSLVFDALRPRLFLTEALDKKRWGETRKELRARRQVCDCVLGVFGMGRIGRRVARVGASLGMRVLYHDLLDVPEAERSGATPVSRDELLRQSDILTIHVDDRPSNRGIVNAQAFALLKPDVVFANAARGLLVDAAACAEFFIQHPAATAMLDVHEPEPFGPTYPLLDIQNVHLSPHIAAATDAAQVNMSWVVRDVWRVLNNEEPQFAAV